MSGFFDQSTLQRPASRMMSVPGCGICKLHKQCHTPKMKPTGEGKKGILFIAEAPGEKEDRRGIQLIGKAGQLHRRTCKRLGIDLDADCRKINAINCRPPNNETPTHDQVIYCRPNLLKEIERFKPKMIIPMGNIAIESLLKHRWNHGELGGINRWRGYTIPDRDLGCWVCPTYHPSFVNRNEGNKAVEHIYRTDMETAFWILKNKPFPIYENEEAKIKCLFDIKSIKKYLLSLLKKKNSIIAFDYETTGLKPHAEGQEIVSIAISTDADSAVSFSYDRRLKTLLQRLLQAKHIYKIAANLKFEEAWSRVILGTEVKGWIWDTCLAAHSLDNRSYSTGLKFQSYVNYGIIDYDSHLSHLLEGVENHANSLNQIHKIPMKELLIYNGMDSMLEYRLAIDQMKIMGILDPIYHFRKINASY